MPVLIAATVLVGGANLAAYAATGSPLLLGHVNTESKTATVANGGTGPALHLKTKNTSPPISVNSSKLVKHLNADQVDGMSAASLQTKVTQYVLPGDGTTSIFKLPGLQKGDYIVNVDLGVTIIGSGNPFCWLTDPNTSAVLASWQNQDPGGTIVLSGSSTITWAGGAQPLEINCLGNAIYHAVGGSLPNTVSFTKIDTLVTGTSVGAMAVPKARNSVGR
jgi:hypothetical protein